MIAIAQGVIIYGLSNISNSSDSDGLKCIISSRVLKFTYGIRSCFDWKEGIDPLDRKTQNAKIYKFGLLAKIYSSVSE